MLITKNCYSSIWPRTKENSYYGYKANGQYYWFKSKATALKYCTLLKTPLIYATYIKETMYMYKQHLNPWVRH